jgi:DNA invertase Pin-like site-specific DNA recombinase
MKAVIYARYSSDNQTENSIEGQLRESKEFAERKGITIFGTYIDRALSAKTDNRPQFQKMIRDSAKGLFDVIIVWKLDRFARNRYDSAHYKAILRKNGVKVISATEPISEDATGILLESLLEGMNEYYIAELSEKVKRGLTENALKCKWNNGSRPVGYFVDDEKKLQIDPLTAPIILEAFKKYGEGEKVVDIVKFLADSGVKHYRGGTLRIDAVQRMFKNRVYIGEYKYGEHITPGGVPQIVPFELFEQVGERMAKNKKAPARFKAEDEYLLTTKLLCGRCEAFMVGESGTSRVGKVHRYYKCVTAKKRKGCNKKSAQKDWIEDLVVSEAVKMLANDEILNKIADLTMDLQRRENITLPLLKKQLVETEKGIENMLNAIQSGVLTSSTKKRLDELEASKSDIEIKILQEEIQKTLLTREQILFWLHKFRGIDVSKREHRQRLIDTFINTVYLYDDKIVLTFNFKEGAKTVTMGDVEESYGSDLTTSSALLRPYLNRH